MPPAIKFCGLTRAGDVAMAESLGAAYVGIILAPSARRVTVPEGREALAGASAGVARVGVFAGWEADAIARAAEALALDVVQLHGANDAALAASLRERRLGLRIWNVVHVDTSLADPGAVAATLHDASRTLAGDATLLDARVDGQLGGTGRSFDWWSARTALAPLRARGPIILAGGLTPENVTRAITLLAPDVVDVSSGVETSPGIKDHQRMRAFADAVHAVHAVHAAPRAEQP